MSTKTTRARSWKRWVATLVLSLSLGGAALPREQTAHADLYDNTSGSITGGGEVVVPWEIFGRPVVDGHAAETSAGFFVRIPHAPKRQIALLDVMDGQGEGVSIVLRPDAHVVMIVSCCGIANGQDTPLDLGQVKRADYNYWNWIAFGEQITNVDAHVWRFVGQMWSRTSATIGPVYSPETSGLRHFPARLGWGVSLIHPDVTGNYYLDVNDHWELSKLYLVNFVFPDQNGWTVGRPSDDITKLVAKVHGKLPQYVAAYEVHHTPGEVNERNPLQDDSGNGHTMYPGGEGMDANPNGPFASDSTTDVLQSKQHDRTVVIVTCSRISSWVPIVGNYCNGNEMHVNLHYHYNQEHVWWGSPMYVSTNDNGGDINFYNDKDWCAKKEAGTHTLACRITYHSTSAWTWSFGTTAGADYNGVNATFDTKAKYTPNGGTGCFYLYVYPDGHFEQDAC